MLSHSVDTAECRLDGGKGERESQWVVNTLR